MTKDPVRGKTIRFTFDDGPMANKTFEHAFDKSGLVSFKMVGGDTKPAKKDAKTAKAPKAKDTKSKYQVATVSDDVCAVSYLSSAGYTLTAVLDFDTNTLVAFSSNDKMLALQHGHFEFARKAS